MEIDYALLARSGAHRQHDMDVQGVFSYLLVDHVPHMLGPFVLVIGCHYDLPGPLTRP